MRGGVRKELTITPLSGKMDQIDPTVISAVNHRLLQQSGFLTYFVLTQKILFKHYQTVGNLNFFNTVYQPFAYRGSSQFIINIGHKGLVDLCTFGISIKILNSLAETIQLKITIGKVIIAQGIPVTTFQKMSNGRIIFLQLIAATGISVIKQRIGRTLFKQNFVHLTSLEKILFIE